MVRICGESLISLWDDLLALKMSKIIKNAWLWNNTGLIDIWTVANAFAEKWALQSVRSPGRAQRPLIWLPAFLGRLAELAQRCWSYPTMCSSNPTNAPDVPAYAFFGRKFWISFIKRVHQEGSSSLAILLLWMGGRTRWPPEVPYKQHFYDSLILLPQHYSKSMHCQVSHWISEHSHLNVLLLFTSSMSFSLM